MLRTLFLVAILSAPAAAGAESLTARGLPLLGSAPLVFSLSPGQMRELRLPRVHGFRVEIDQRNAEFVLEFLDGDARSLRTVDAFGWQIESATFAPGSAARVLRVRRADRERRVANFAVCLVDLPAFTGKDETILRAEDASTSARSLLRAARTVAETRAAIAAARQAVDIWRQAGDAESVLRASILLADSLNRSGGNIAEAGRIYTDALPHSRELGDIQSEAEILTNLGVSLRRRSLFIDALHSLHDALETWRRLPPQSDYAACLNDLALTEFEIAEYAGALDHFSESLRVVNALGVHDGEPFIFNNKALVEGALGEWSASIRSFERAAAGFESAGDFLGAGRALSNSARMYLRVGDAARAEANVKRGLVLIDRAHDDHARSESLNLLGEVYTSRRRFDDAFDTLHEARDLARKIGDERAEANALTSIGLAMVGIHGEAAAAESFEDALAIFRKFGTPAAEASLLYYLARARRDSGQLESAQQAAAEAVEIAESIRSDVTAENLRVSFLASTHDYYSALIDILMRKGLVEQAWNVAERARARVLLEKIGAGDESESQREIEYELNSESTRLMRDSGDAENVRQHIVSLSGELTRAGGDRAAIAQSPIPDLAAVRKWLGEDTALIEYSVNDSGGGYGWIVTRSSLTSFPLPDGRAIQADTDAIVVRMRSDQSGSTDDATLRTVAQRLSSVLIAPAHVAGLRVHKLVIVPDGPLESLPFDLLPAGTAAALIDKYEIVESPSAAVALALTRRREERTTNVPRGILLVADPVFDAGDSRIGANRSASSGPARFSRLAFSHREAQAIAALRPPAPVTMMLGFDASKQFFTSKNLSGFGWIHISTHGIADGPGADAAGLVLSLVDRSGSRRDGILSVSNVTSLRLNARVVVLDACDTALGKHFAGEGVLSLSRAFLYAGADRVIAARWPVEDEFAATFLTAFYRSTWRDGLSPPAALRQAQLILRRDPRWSSPFYWAAFVLQGEP